MNGADADWNSIQNAKGVVNFHEFIRAEMKKMRMSVIWQRN